MVGSAHLKDPAVAVVMDVYMINPFPTVAASTGLLSLKDAQHV